MDVELEGPGACGICAYSYYELGCVRFFRGCYISGQK